MKVNYEVSCSCKRVYFFSENIVNMKSKLFLLLLKYTRTTQSTINQASLSKFNIAWFNISKLHVHAHSSANSTFKKMVKKKNMTIKKKNNRRLLLDY